MDYWLTTVHPMGTPFAPDIVHVASADFTKIPQDATPATQLVVIPKVVVGSFVKSALM